MRVGVLTTSYPRTPDDPAGHFVAGFARWLTAHVGEVEVLAADSRWPIFYRGGAPAMLGSARNWSVAAAFSARLAGAAAKRARKWDAIVSHWLVPCAAVGALHACGRRHVAIAHGSDVRLLERLPGGGRLIDLLARKADLVFVADALRTRNIGRVASMGVDPAIHSPRIRPANQRLRVLYLGRLSREKGADLAIAALPDDMQLTIAGDGPERSSLTHLARGKAIEFTGEIRGEDKARALASADVLIVPSRADGSPTVIAEGHAAGLPVLATNVGGIAERLGGAGLMCAPTVGSLRTGLERMRDAALRDKLSQAGRQIDVSWEAAGPRVWGRPGAQKFAQPHSLQVVWV